MPPNPADRPARYHTFLLSVWEEGGDGLGWRFRLEDPHTGERVGFRSLSELTRYLGDWASRNLDEPLGG